MLHASGDVDFGESPFVGPYRTVQRVSLVGHDDVVSLRMTRGERVPNFGSSVRVLLQIPNLGIRLVTRVADRES